MFFFVLHLLTCLVILLYKCNVAYKQKRPTIEYLSIYFVNIRPGKLPSLVFLFSFNFLTRYSDGVNTRL